jgi:aspartyl/asparaginyl beta-hydroxylase (cupin superfamily)
MPINIFMDKENFVQRLLSNYDEMFEEYSNYHKRTIALPGWDKDATPIEHWRSITLWWNYKPMLRTQKFFPVSTELVREGPTHKASGWLLLHPHSSTPVHKHDDWGKKIILHIPMVIPDGDVGFNVDGKVHRWVPKEPFAFDVTQTHYGFNNTDNLRAIFVLDFDYDEWIDVLKPFMSLTNF